MADRTSSATEPRVVPLDPVVAPAGSRELLEDAQSRRGSVSGLLRLLAHSPAALGGYLAFDQAMASAVLPAALRERIAVAVAAANRCSPCLAVHTKLGRAAGLSEDELAAACDGASADPAAAAALRFAGALLRGAGRVSDEDLAAVRKASFGDAEIVEITAVVFLNAFTNAANGLASAGKDAVRAPDADPVACAAAPGGEPCSTEPGRDARAVRAERG
jgi:uncharacterized peroxidase-related enzyme